MHPFEAQRLLSLGGDLDAAVARVRRRHGGRACPDDSALLLADLAERIAAILQEFGDRPVKDARSRSPADVTAPPASCSFLTSQKGR